uniref:Uncharacterized protein n=1 Tax=viral metagenome TaxID=1070528 RepID=A0A6M3L7C5_9ZZZZ
MSLHVTHICDRCGARESTLPAGKPITEPTILPFATKGLPDDLAFDLCQPCAAIIRANLVKLLSRQSEDLLKLD